MSPMTERAPSVGASTCGAACAPARIVGAGSPPQNHTLEIAGLFVLVALAGTAAVITLRSRAGSNVAPARLLGLGVAAIVGALFSIFSAARAFDGGSMVIFVFRHPGPFDQWFGLSTAEVVLAVIGTVGMWFAFTRKRPLSFLGFTLLQLPLPLFIEAIRF